MAKSPDAFRTISEVSDWLDTPAHVLRFWESKFTQVKPVKRAGGRRYYRPEDMALLGGIKTLLHEQGMTIKGVQKLLREQGAKHVSALGPQPLDDGGQIVPANFTDLMTEDVEQAAAVPANSAFVAKLPSDKPVFGIPQPLSELPAETDPGPGLLSRVIQTDSARIRARRTRLAPLVQRLDRLLDRMQRDRA